VVEGGITLADEVSSELKQKVIDYLKTVSKAKNREVARAIEMDKGIVDKAIASLSKEARSNTCTWERHL
jgi:hypothetical protein